MFSKDPERTNGGRKRCLYFDPDGTCATFVDIPVTNSCSSDDQFAMLELLDPFLSGRELVHGCRVRVAWDQRHHYYMVYTKYRRSQENISVRDESNGQESWKGPVVVMRLDTRSATRLVSMTSGIHRELAIRAMARYIEFSFFVLLLIDASRQVCPTYESTNLLCFHSAEEDFVATAFIGSTAPNSLVNT